MQSTLVTDSSKSIVVLTTREAARRYGIKEKTLAHWRVAGTGPDYFMVGRYCFYETKKVKAWLEAKNDKKGNRKKEQNRTDVSIHKHIKCVRKDTPRTGGADVVEADADRLPGYFCRMYRNVRRIMEGVRRNG
jgi:hypothetical protein